MKSFAARFLCGLFATLIFSGGLAQAGTRLRFGAAVSLTPLVAPQAIAFGQNTLVGHGSVAPVVTSGAITSAACTGTNSGDFTEASDGTFTTTVTPLQLSYSLSCTYGNSFGTSPATAITIIGEPSTYSEASEAELQVTQAISTATMSGRTIKMRWRATPYQWALGDGTGWFRNKAYTAETTLTSHDLNNRATFLVGCVDSSVTTGCTQLRGTSNFTIASLKFYAPFHPTWLGTGGVNTVAQAQGAALSLTGTSTNLTIRDNDLSSNWKELVDTYGFPILYQNYPGCPPSTPGEWALCYTYRGIISATQNLAGSFTYINNVAHDSWRLLQTGVGATTVKISDNEFYNFSGDAMNVNGHTPTSTEISWNSVHDLLSYTTSTIHLDAFQFIPGVGGADIINVMVFGNQTKAVRTDNYRTLPNISTIINGHFMEDIQPHNYVHAWVFGNLVDASGVYGVGLYNPVDSCVCGNTGVMNPSIDATTNAPYTRILQQLPATAPPHDNEIADNISLGSSYPNSAWGVLVNNQVADPGASSGATSYSTLFTGPTFEPGTLAETVAAYTPLAGSTPLTSTPKMGALGTYFDYVNHIWDYPRLNTVAAFAIPDSTATGTSTLTNSTGQQISGIVRSDGASSAFGALVRVSGGIAPAFRITSDAGCTTPVVDWTSAPGEAIDPGNGNYVCVRDVSSSSAAATTNILVRVGGKSDTWSITTP